MNNTKQFRSSPLPGAILIAAGSYLMIGFVYVLFKNDWPPFWPPMNSTTAVLELFPEASVIAAAIILGTLAVLSGPILFILGLRRVFLWHNEVKRNTKPAMGSSNDA